MENPNLCVCTGGQLVGQGPWLPVCLRGLGASGLGSSEPSSTLVVALTFEESLASWRDPCSARIGMPQ